jgi:O-antigen/teichoic acid export membrane protein
MISEGVIENTQEEVIKSPKGKKKESLKQRGFLNALTSMIDYAGAQLTGLVVSPFIVGGLGNSMYGIWQMLSQMTGYAKMADSRATQVLKWTVAKKQDTASIDELRSDVTSALVVTLFILPIILIAGGIISWYAPYITKADPAYHNIIRITCSLLILSLSISRFFELFEAVLRGMNLGYKRMGFRAGIVVVGGALKILAITQGFGLIGLSIVHILITLMTGLTFYFIVKKSVGWFGFGKTNFKKVVSFSKLSGWYMANTASDTLLTNSDKVLLGFVASPVLVSYYALTTFLPLAVQGVIFRVIIGIIPGIGKLFGLQEYAKINKVWGNVNDFIFLLSTASGVTILLFNNSFLNIWVGEGHFAGNIANALIIVMVLQDTFIKHDGYIITATLDLKKKVFLTLRSSVVFLLLGFVAVHYFGIAGLCISIISGKFLLFIGQRKVLREKIQNVQNNSFLKRLQPLLVSLSMLGVAYYLSGFVGTVNLYMMIGLVPVTFIMSLLIFYKFGLRKNKREELVQIVSSIKYFKKK